ncbi:unnamed protein product [Bemisia tabaci]|uniref:CCHC-type domain-containing protein n=1 Tax=Bemisia tabaci TaxID=7038 RepID=A0A9P0ANH6_BEMTA|nr:unnamed protein product [Bemisia tabaci]
MSSTGCSVSSKDKKELAKLVSGEVRQPGWVDNRDTMQVVSHLTSRDPNLHKVRVDLGEATDESPESFKEKLQKKDPGLKFEGYRQRGSMVHITVRDPKSREAIYESAKENPQIQIKEISPPSAVFKISYLEEDLTADKIAKDLYSKNLNHHEGWTETKVAEAMKIFVDRKAINKGGFREFSYRVIYFRAFGGLEILLAPLTSVYIGASKCRIEPTVYVLPCMTCGSLDHRKDRCTISDKYKDKQICFRCCQRNHVARECKGNVFCINCHQAGMKSTAHSITSYDCPIFKREREYQMNQVKWGRKEPVLSMTLEGEGNGEKGPGGDHDASSSSC